MASDDMDDVFSALAHRLRARGGLTLCDREQGVPEKAGLIAPCKAGRETRHDLNPMSLQQAADRRIARTVADLASAAERDAAVINVSPAGPSHRFTPVIRAAPAAVRALVTDDARTPRWPHVNATARTPWRAGRAIAFFSGGQAMIAGPVPAPEPPHWPEPAAEAAATLTPVPDDFGGDTATARAPTGGGRAALSRLKTLAEAGTRVLMAPPARAAG